jgi:hypothetical protein
MGGWAAEAAPIASALALVVQDFPHDAAPAAEHLPSIQAPPATGGGGACWSECASHRCTNLKGTGCAKGEGIPTTARDTLIELQDEMGPAPQGHTEAVNELWWPPSLLA